MSIDHYDVLIIGAGLSGIGMACRLAEAAPGKRVGILERRHAIGGTWTSSAIPECARIRTCSRSATASGPGTS